MLYLHCVYSVINNESAKAQNTNIARSCMATKNKKSWSVLCEIRKGPGRKQLKKALNWAIDFAFTGKSEDYRPEIFDFGTTPNGYRMFPIRIEAIMLESEKLNIFGAFDYREHSNVVGARLLNNKRVRILGYDVRTRSAEKLEIFE